MYSKFKDCFQINEHNFGTWNRNILLQVPKVKLQIAESGSLFMGAKLYSVLHVGIRESADDLENEANSVFIDLYVDIIGFNKL